MFPALWSTPQAQQKNYFKNFWNQISEFAFKGALGNGVTMANEYFFSEVQLDVQSNPGIATEAGMDDFLNEEPATRRSNHGRARNEARWRANPMRDAENSKMSPARDKPLTARASFLPEVSLPSNLPPEPVAIADMANMFGVTHRTLHFYEEKGIISSRRAGLMRIYSHQDVRRMAVINFFREIGIPVATIQDIMQKLADATCQEDADTIFQDLLNARKLELAEEVSTVRRQIQQISDILTDDNAQTLAERPFDDASVELTVQERRCLELMAEGYAPVRLARTLEVTPEELQKLEACVMDKVSASNRFQAVAKAYMMGVISQDKAQTRSDRNA